MCAMGEKYVFDNVLFSSFIVWLGHSVFPAMKLCILRCSWLRTITSDYVRSGEHFRYLLIGLHLIASNIHRY